MVVLSRGARRLESLRYAYSQRLALNRDLLRRPVRIGDSNHALRGPGEGGQLLARGGDPEAAGAGAVRLGVHVQRGAVARRDVPVRAFEAPRQLPVARR